MNNRRNFFKQLTGVVLTASGAIPLPIKKQLLRIPGAIDIRNRLVSIMEKEIQDEIDRDIINRMVSIYNLNNKNG